MDAAIISSAARIGHVHLRVADLDRATAFYRDVLGFAVTIYGPTFGLQAAFLAAGDYHHYSAGDGAAAAERSLRAIDAHPRQPSDAGDRPAGGLARRAS